MFGKKFNLENESEILKIKSPKKSVTKGPFCIVFKDDDEKERWAIVALEWENEPRLGMRWFWSSNGFPARGKHALWMVIPPKLAIIILDGLSDDNVFKSKIIQFLNSKISGNQLKKEVSL
jgi:hypothetical protein